MKIFQNRRSQEFEQKNKKKRYEEVTEKVSIAKKKSNSNMNAKEQHNQSKNTEPEISEVKTFSVKSQKFHENKTYKNIKIGNNIQTEIDYGIFNQYRLDEFFNIENNLEEGQVVSVATIESHALHLEAKFLNLMEKYNEYEIAFVGVYGPKGCGKSLFLDKILNLATFEGSHFTQVKNPKSKKEICLWSIPLSRGKEKIFLADCTGYVNEKEKLGEDQMLCDFLLFLCSSIVLIEPYKDENSNDFITDFSSMLKNSMSRIHFNKVNFSKGSSIWPGIFSFAYRNEVRDNFNQLKKYFIRSDYRKLGDAKDPKVEGKLQDNELKEILLEKYADRNKLMLNESYIKTASEYLLSFYENCYPKFYHDIKPNGNGISTILMNFVLGINCKEKINISSVIEKTFKEILVEAYNSTVNWYTNQLQKNLGKEEPINSNELISIFEKLFYKAFIYFQKSIKTSLKIDPIDLQSLSQVNQLEEKLEKYIREKELLIIKINEKKTSKTLKKEIDKKIDISKMPLQEIIELREILYRFKTIEKHLDMNRSNCFKEKIMEGWNKFIFNEETKKNAEIEQLEQQIETKRVELKKMAEKNLKEKTKIAQNVEKFSQMNRYATELAAKVENLRFEIDIQKRTNLEKLENSYERIHLTSRNEQDLMNKLKEYEKKLEKSSFIKGDELKTLREELEEAYKIEAEETKKFSLPNSLPQNSNDIYANNSFPNLGKRLVSQYEFQNQQKLDSINYIPSLEEISLVNKQKENESLSQLLKSRIAKNTESVRLLKYQIDEKVKTEQELQDKISSNFISLSRVTTEYRNNQMRGSESRKIKTPKSNKKEELPINRENELSRKRLFESGKKNNGASQPVKGIFANLI